MSKDHFATSKILRYDIMPLTSLARILKRYNSFLKNRPPVARSVCPNESEQNCFPMAGAIPFKYSPQENGEAKLGLA